MRLFDLTGKVALVTGGNGGIGLGMAQGMASCGASIVIAGRNADKAGPALASLRELGARCAFIAGDVTKKAACVKLVADTMAEFGRLYILSTTPAPQFGRCRRTTPRKSGTRCWTPT
jgi:2-dehydro-3-deoxy-D-gluconate 5-dehydrogenase